jgi:hypothetical protein
VHLKSDKFLKQMRRLVLPGVSVAAFFLGFSLLGGAEETAATQGNETVRYRGFMIDGSRVRRLQNLDAVIAATKEQIDIVCAVGVPDEIMAFFRSVPFEVVPPGTIAPGNPGLYSSKTKTVRVTSIVVTAGHKPILLHELLHAFHDQRVRDGFRNAEIARFYAQAQMAQAYPAKSHMMLNDREFFACAGTTYLFGVTAQEPFRRDKVKDRQPMFFNFLQAIFGPAAGAYQGSLTSPVQ